MHDRSTATSASTAANPWRLSVAPMMDWTDKHCRYFHRLLTKQTRLYTEMVTTGALIHGDVARHPVAGGWQRIARGDVRGHLGASVAQTIIRSFSLTASI